MRRHSFTLVELLVTVTIIAILLAVGFGTLHAAKEVGRKMSTRATITKIRSVIAAARESYQTRRIRWRPADNYQYWIDTNGDGVPDSPDLRIVLQVTWNAKRDLLRTEMPDRFSDFLQPLQFVIRFVDSDGDGVPDSPVLAPVSDMRPRDFRHRYSEAKRRLTAQGLSANDVAQRLASYELSECLYMTVMAHGGNRIAWRSDERGDADRDGLKEFHDAWGHPILWLRWPAGWPGADEPPIGYDPSVNPTLATLGPQPIVISAGPDGIYDVNRGVEPDGSGGWMTYVYGLDFAGNLNPWTVDEWNPPRQIGEPVDATAPNGDPPNGDMNHHDNLTSWDRPG